MKRLVLIGGGHSHVAVLKAFGKTPPPDTELILVSRDRETPYSGMLPGLIAGHFKHAQCHIDLERLAAFANCRLVVDSAEGLDLAAGQVRCAKTGAMPFDLLSIDVGSTPDLGLVDGATEHAIPVKPVDRFLEACDRIAQAAIRSRRMPGIAMVGGGAAGVEVLLALQHRLIAAGVPGIPGALQIITESAEVLPGHAPRVRRIMAALLKARHITVHAGMRAIRVQRGVVECESRRLLTAHVLWATGAAAPEWLRETGLELDDRGFISVDDSLRALGHGNVFAAGDVATMVNHPRPKSGVYAVRQGPPLAANLRLALAGAEPMPYTPQADALALISTGNKYAIASKGGLALKGRWVWYWKMLIDRRFMAAYRFRR